jgi:hypothetical protein
VVSPVPLIPQESRTFYSNQLGIGVKLQKCTRSNNLLEKSIKKEDSPKAIFSPFI